MSKLKYVVEAEGSFAQVVDLAGILDKVAREHELAQTLTAKLEFDEETQTYIQTLVALIGIASGESPPADYNPAGDRPKARIAKREDGSKSVADTNGIELLVPDYSTDAEIAIIGINERIRNCLRRAEIECVRHLLECDEDFLLSLTNFGSSSLQNVKIQLLGRGLELRSPNTPIRLWEDLPIRWFRGSIRSYYGTRLNTIGDLLLMTEKEVATRQLDTADVAKLVVKINMSQQPGFVM